MPSLITHFILVSIISSMSLLDIIWTYFNVRKLSNHSDIDESECELNPIVRYLWRNIGIKKTAILYVFLTPVLIISFFTYMYYDSPELYPYGIGIFIGAYVIINFVHRSNTIKLREVINETQ